jgi:hypothetical protein
MASDDIEDLTSVVVRSSVHKSLRALLLPVVTIYKCLVNPILYPNPMSNH